MINNGEGGTQDKARAQDLARAREVYDRGCKSGNRAACSQLARVQQKGAPEVGPPPSPARSPTAAPPADPLPPREACSLDRVAGTYQTTYGRLACTVRGGALDCCYGAACEKLATLRFDGAQQNMVGTWRYPDGTHGAVTFPVSSQCTLQLGQWSHAGRTVQHRWPVRGKR
jgi:hypothetical protein